MRFLKDTEALRGSLDPVSAAHGSSATAGLWNVRCYQRVSQGTEPGCTWESPCSVACHVSCILTIFICLCLAEAKKKVDSVEEEISALKKQVSEQSQAAGKVKKRITAKVRSGLGAGRLASAFTWGLTDAG